MPASPQAEASRPAPNPGPAISRTITARYLAPQAYARLLDTLADAHHDVDPINVIVNALGEWANVWPAEIQADPHALPKCGLCG